MPYMPFSWPCKNRVKNWDSQWTINSLLNGTVFALSIIIIMCKDYYCTYLRPLHDSAILLLLPESFRVLLSCADWGFYYLNLTGIKKFKGKWILVLVVKGHRQANGRVNKAQDIVGYFYHLTKKISLPLVLRVAERVVWEDLSLEYQYESVENNQATKLDIFYN